MAGTRVKICGITCPEDALYATAHGADALGFVFYPGSPRCVTPERAAEIIGCLPPFVATVGLFVNAPVAEIEEVSAFCRLDWIQLHGDETPEQCQLIGRKLIKALRVRDRQSLARACDYQVAALLLDAWVAERYGGSGACFDWTLAAEAAIQKPLILAGGLTPDNVAEAIAQVKPFAVDVSSGVESAPGRKDPEKVARFIHNAKTCKDVR